MKGGIDMPKKINLINQVFNRLIVLEDSGQRNKAGSVLWKCQCECGNITLSTGSELKNGHKKSCGCLQKEKASLNKVNMLGFENNGIIVIAEAPSDDKGFAQWKCKCKKCGQEFI
jgi:hypothetical protein